jgi:hypothetical protein
MRNIYLLIIAFVSQINYGQNTYPFPSSGNVGIGTINPSVPLDVIGTVKIQSSNSNYNENLRLLPSLLGDYSSIALGAVSGNSGTGVGQWTLVRYPAANNYMFSLRYNSTDFFNISNKGNVGIGTADPQAKLHVNNGDNSYGAILANSTEAAFSLYAKSLTTQPVYAEAFRLGMKYYNQEENGFISFYRGSSASGGFLGFSSSGVERMRINEYGNIGIGISNPQNKLDVNGTIHSQEVKVDMSGWSDFVFKKEYSLPTLEEVEKHIAEKGHLENIPSEEEVLKDGISLGEMNAKLLQKIEELTLYMIEMKKENENIKKENAEMKKDISMLKTKQN